MSDFENQGLTPEDYARMSDDQLEVFRQYDIELPENLNELRQQAAAAEPPAGDGPGVNGGGNPEDGGEQDGDEPAAAKEPAGQETPADDGGEPADPSEPEEPDEDGDSVYAELQKKERNGELTKRETRKLEAIRKQQRELEDRRQLNDKILGLERTITELKGASAKQTEDLFAKYFGQAGLLEDAAKAQAGAQQSQVPQQIQPAPGTVPATAGFTLESRLAQMEKLLLSREQQAQAERVARERETAARELEKDVTALSELAPGVKTAQDVQNLDRFPQMLQIMQTQIDSGMPRDIRAAYTMVYQDEIIEREIRRRVESQSKIDRADAQSRSAVTNSHLKGLPNAAAHEALISPEMRRVAAIYGIEKDEDIREVYKDQLRT
jgi:hypothetical protein